MYKTLLVALTASALSTGAVAAAPAVKKEPLGAATLSAIKSKFGRLMGVGKEWKVASEIILPVPPVPAATSPSRS